jgi:hypothetical protein
MANNVIDRNSLSGLIPEPVTREILQGAVAESAVLRMARRLPNMTSKTQTMNVLDMLPTAYWVNGEVSGTGALVLVALFSIVVSLFNVLSDNLAIKKHRVSTMPIIQLLSCGWSASAGSPPG